MAPKKGKGKDTGPVVPEVQTLYEKREPLPSPELPDVSEVEVAWKSARSQSSLPLPPWDDEEVDTTEWKPSEIEDLYKDQSFAVRALARPFLSNVVAWRRAHIATESPAAEESEPTVLPIPEIEEPPPPVDPKAKAKAEPKAKGKAAAPEPVVQKPTTAEQFEELEPGPGEGIVVSQQEFRSREVNLSNDDASPPLCQAIAAQFALIGEIRQFIPRGFFLWELIYPQDADGMPYFNPHGKYIVKLFIQGMWRQVTIDDVVPVGIAAAGYSAVHASVFPSSTLPNTIWPQLLTKALLRAFQSELQVPMLYVITALTGWFPCQLSFTWPSLHASFNSRLFCIFQKGSEVDVEAKQRDASQASAITNPPPPEAGSNGGLRKLKAGMPEMPMLQLQREDLTLKTPKLGAQPGDALMPFIVCETLEDPQQVRLKAATWRPGGGSPRRVTIKDYESEDENDDEEEEEALGHRGEEVLPPSEIDYDQEDEEDDVERRSQRSPVGGGGSSTTGGGAAATDVAKEGASARSKEEGGGASAADAGDAAPKDAPPAAEGGAPPPPADAPPSEEVETVPANPWPQEQAPFLLPRSMMKEHRAELTGGFWISREQLLETCDSYFVMLPQGDRLLFERLDTMWANGRKEAFTPPPVHVIKIRLVPGELEVEHEETDVLSHEGEEEQQKKQHGGKPWFRTFFSYEALRPDPIFGGGREVTSGIGGANIMCSLVNVTHWKPKRTSRDGTAGGDATAESAVRSSEGDVGGVSEDGTSHRGRTGAVAAAGGGGFAQGSRRRLGGSCHDETDGHTEGSTNGPLPEVVNLSVGEGPTSCWTTAHRSVLLPPGEHWYMVQDDAIRAGSVLSVRVEGNRLKMEESSIEFVPLVAALKEMGPGVVQYDGLSEYPPQRGFSIWAKVEVTIAPEVLDQISGLQLMTQVSDPTLLPFLRVTFLRYTAEVETEATRRCSQWGIVQLDSAPLLPAMTLSLGCGAERETPVPPVPAGWEAKYIVVLEANVPHPAKAGKFSMHVLVPPGEVEVPAVATASGPGSEDGEGGEAAKGDGAGEEDERPGMLQLTSLKADNVIRWAGSTEPNSAPIVLRERLTVAIGAGDVTATVRITVTGLPNAFLRVKLVAQLPPEEEMRPKLEDGSSPEPIVLGAPIDCKEYGGRMNWLSCCRTVLEDCGVEIVMLPHIVFCEGSVYRLDVFLDPFKGPDNLEGGSWLLELHASGDVEAGADATELDLEAVVVKSWEDPEQDPAKPLRKECAAESRLKWRREKGHLPMPSEEELAREAEEKAAAAAAAVDPKAKGKKDDARSSKLAMATDENPEMLAAQKAAEEAAALDAALRRASDIKHTNKLVADFLKSNAENPAMLDVYDPWTVAPDAPPPQPLGAEEEHAEDVEEGLAEARRALGAAGLEEVRVKEVEETNTRWEQLFMHMESAKDRNVQALADLAAWREEQMAFDIPFLADRAELQGVLKVRSQKRDELKSLVNDVEVIDVAALQNAMDEATKVGVGSLDKDLLEIAGQKVAFLEAFPSLQAKVETLVEEPLGEDGRRREELTKMISAVRESVMRLQKAKVAISPEFPFLEVLGQAVGALSAPCLPPEPEG
eukprot:TRINITY_DN42196_c0_g1_i1.p1 TRINITY_DN42196_c0_g1~~TRINITY_DN42196_c0_g1_i1.p1  ORF type:complete len:1595 (-),score=402.63 TRINITY_DN42196_c0_g1_i1:87-4871(-)